MVSVLDSVRPFRTALLLALSSLGFVGCTVSPFVKIGEPSHFRVAVRPDPNRDRELSIVAYDVKKIVGNSIEFNDLHQDKLTYSENPLRVRAKESVADVSITFTDKRYAGETILLVFKDGAAKRSLPGVGLATMTLEPDPTQASVKTPRTPIGPTRQPH